MHNGAPLNDYIFCSTQEILIFHQFVGKYGTTIMMLFCNIPDVCGLAYMTAQQLTECIKGST